jgi:ribosomal protein S18 acetylase RimI-like enzyme
MGSFACLPPFQRHYRPDQFGYSSRVVFLEQPVAAVGDWVEQAPRWSPDVDAYLAAYHRVGHPWLWADRLAGGRPAIERDLERPEQICWRIDRAGRLAGFCELILRASREAEILHCGLVSDARGHGLGKCLLTSALAGARAMGARRIWLHTCSEDSPAALGFYQAAGFRIVATRLEWVIDARRRGLLPATAGAAVDLPWTGAAAAGAFSADSGGDSGAARPLGNRPES